MDEINIEIYTKEWCPYCRRTKMMLNSMGLDFTDYEITDDESLQQEMVERSGNETIPQIFINGQNIGGYESLIKKISSEEFDQLIEFKRPNCSNKDWDVTVIGAGPAGMNAAVYSVRKGLNTLLVARDIGGQVIETDTIDNYLPEYGSRGPDLMEDFLQHIRNYEIDTLFGEEVTDIINENKAKTVFTKSEKEITTKTVIIATGSKKRQLGVPGENHLKDKGVSYCATCDGFLYENQSVAVVGGGNSGLEAAQDMAKIAKEVYLLIRSERMSGDEQLQDKVNNSDKIKTCKSSQVIEILGEEKVNGLKVKNINTGKLRKLNVTAIFIEIGLIPNTGFISENMSINDNNEIIIDANNKTSIEGIYAAGDVTNIKDKQIVISAAEGAKAALRVSEYLS